MDSELLNRRFDQLIPDGISAYLCHNKNGSAYA